MIMKRLQLWATNHFTGVMLGITLFVLSFVAAALFLQNQRIIDLGKTLKDQNDRLIRYEECIAKLNIAPPRESKMIEGEIEDPIRALEECKIIVDGVITQSDEPSSTTTTRPTRNQPAAQRAGTTQQRSTNQSRSNPGGGGNNGDDEDPPEPGLLEQSIDAVCENFPDLVPGDAPITRLC